VSAEHSAGIWYLIRSTPGTLVKSDSDATSTRMFRRLPQFSIRWAFTHKIVDQHRRIAKSWVKNAFPSQCQQLITFMCVTHHDRGNYRNLLLTYRSNKS
jgi:hypothetical protein